MPRVQMSPARKAGLYWWHGVPLPALVESERRRWCYAFDWLTEYRMGLLSYCLGSENGRRYHWWRLGGWIPGPVSAYDVTRCFGRRLRSAPAPRQR